MIRNKLLSIALCFAALYGCGNAGIKLQETDRAYKDSLSAAEGYRALGDFYFGMCRDSFEMAKKRFLKAYGNKLYGQPLQTIDANFNMDGLLWQVIFVSPQELETPNQIHPYYEFARKKFGLETCSGIWQVGQRKVILTTQNRSMEMEWFLERAYERALNSGMGKHHSTKVYDPLETFDFYVMSIQNDSLEKAYIKSLAVEKQRLWEEKNRKAQQAEKAEQMARQKQLREL